MLLLELSFKGVREIPDGVQLKLQPGLNVLSTGNAELRRGLLDVVYHALYADSSRADATRWLCRDGAAKSFASVVVYGRDKITYRVIRNLQNGATRLEKYDPQTKKFDTLSSSASEASQYLRVQQHLPDDVAYERIFMLSPDMAPSKGSKARLRSAQGEDPLSSGPVAPGLPGSMPLGGVRAPPRVDSSMFPVDALDPGTMPGYSAVLPAGMSALGTGDLPRMGSGIFNPANALVRAELSSPGGDLMPTVSDPTVDPKSEYVRVRKQIELQEKAEQAQGEIERKNQRKTALKEKVGMLEKLEAELKDAQSALSGNTLLLELPDGMVDRVKNLEKATEKRDLELKRLGDERDNAEKALEEVFVQPLVQDPYFLGGVGVAGLALLGIVVAQAPALAVVNVLAGVVAVAASFRFVGELEEKSKRTLRMNVIEERKARIEKQYELETSVVRKMLQSMDIEDPRELLQVLGEAEAAKERVARLTGRLEHLKSDPEVRAAAKELATVDRELDDLEAAVLSAAGADASVPLSELKRQRKRLEDELKKEKVDPEALFAGGGAGGGKRTTIDAAAVFDDDDDDDGYGGGYGGGRGGSGQPPGGLYAIGGLPPGASALGSAGSYPGGGGVDPIAEVLKAGLDTLHTGLDGLLPKIERRFSQYLTALTNKRYEQAVFSPRGALSVRPAGGGDPTPFASLEPELQDLIEAALRLTLAEQVVTKVRAPLLIDDPFAKLDPRRRAIFKQMLEYFARATQVVVVTELADLGGHALSVG